MNDRSIAGTPQHEDEGVPDSRHATLSLDEFFRANFRPVVGLLLSMGANLEEAQDAAQEAMTEVAQRWDTIRNPRAYVRTVARNAYYKMNVDEAKLRSPNSGMTRVDLDPDAMVDTEVLEEWIITLTEVDAVLNVIQKLPERQRETLALYLSGMSPLEISQQLGRNPATVRSNLRHGLKALKETLAIPDDDPTRTGRQPS